MGGVNTFTKVWFPLQVRGAKSIKLNAKKKRGRIREWRRYQRGHKREERMAYLTKNSQPRRIPTAGLKSTKTGRRTTKNLREQRPLNRVVAEDKESCNDVAGMEEKSENTPKSSLRGGFELAQWRISTRNTKNSIGGQIASEEE